MWQYRLQEFTLLNNYPVDSFRPSLSYSKAKIPFGEPVCRLDHKRIPKDDYIFEYPWHYVWWENATRASLKKKSASLARFKRRILHAPNRIAKLSACKMRRLNQLNATYFNSMRVSRIFD